MRGLVLGVKSLFYLISTSSGEEQSVEAKIVEEGCVSLSVPEGVDVPPYLWGNAKFVFKPLMACVEVADDVFVVSVSFVGSDPSSHGNFEPAFFNKLLDSSLSVFILSFVPHTEEFHFNVGELSLGVLQKLIDHLRNELADVGVGLVPLNAGKVLMVSFEPPNIIVSMGDHMHC